MAAKVQSVFNSGCQGKISKEVGIWSASVRYIRVAIKDVLLLAERVGLCSGRLAQKYNVGFQKISLEI